MLINPCTAPPKPFETVKWPICFDRTHCLNHTTHFLHSTRSRRQRFPRQRRSRPGRGRARSLRCWRRARRRSAGSRGGAVGAYIPLEAGSPRLGTAAVPAGPALVLPQGIMQEKEVEKIMAELEQQGTDVPVASKSKVWPKSPHVG